MQQHSDSESATGHSLPGSVNYHVNRSCNFSCLHCFATFDDHPPGEGIILPKASAIQLVRLLALEPPASGQSRRKLTFAGGEPTLVRWLPELIRTAADHGLVTQLVTNGSKLTEDYLGVLADHGLSYVTLSVDSSSDSSNRRIGRAQSGQVITAKRYIEIADRVRSLRMGLKMNTVVNAFNCEEEMTDLVIEMRPIRWKILQAMQVSGQNDTQFTEVEVSLSQFHGFVDRHRKLESEGIELIPEEAERDIRGTYAMIDPLGRFFDSTSGRHSYSLPILDIGINAAWRMVAFDSDRFTKRDGNAWSNDSLHLSRTVGTVGIVPQL